MGGRKRIVPKEVERGERVDLRSMKVFFHSLIHSFHKYFKFSTYYVRLRRYKEEKDCAQSPKEVSV